MSLSGTASARAGMTWPRALLWTAVPVAAALYQVTAKLAAQGGPHHLLWLAAVVACDLACFVAWLGILEKTSLAAAFPLSAIGYLLVMAAGAVLFHERLPPAEIAGSLLILVGVRLVAGGRT